MSPRFNFFRPKKKHLCFLLIVVVFLALKSLLFEETPGVCPDREEPVDAVYTWVNGSDPRFRANLKKYFEERGVNNTRHHYLNQRFDDKHELKFSLRALEKHAPWIGRVFIVTNGQIPHWLDLDYEKVTLVTHEQIFDDENDLPTFSSPAIESHLHNIPGLSRRFIYLNDDIFFGAPVYPDDFYSPSRGFLIYLAYPLPECSLDCPWIYVGDGQCDSACQNKDCQMDGGDCEKGGESAEQQPNSDDNSPPFDVKKILQSRNETPPVNYTRVVLKHNKIVMEREKLGRKRRRPRYGGSSVLVSKIRNADRNRNAVDTYSASLQHTNRRLNLKYGKFLPRQVPAHAPIFIDRHIAGVLAEDFREEFAKTSASRVRSPEDMQFSFAYYYYVMQEKRSRGAAEIFDEFDTDGSGTWSDREIRTILTKLYELPLTFAVVDHFESLLQNCTRFGGFADVPTPEFERYVDSKLPTITKEMVTGCDLLADILKERFGAVPKYKFEVMRRSHEKLVAFKMLASNVSDVVGHLDEIRRKPRKFICLNDNLDERREDENRLIRAILYDFYLSLYPQPSRFELPVELRNRFRHVDDLLAWKSYRLVTWAALVAACCLAAVAMCRRRCCRRAVNLLL